LIAGFNLEKFKWNQLNLSHGLNLTRGSNSLNSGSGLANIYLTAPNMAAKVSKVVIAIAIRPGID